jgi:23S rRNA (cytidine1920-2'-O)/16S rRNA (cytidine1409-2'-O)-methyltransferase
VRRELARSRQEAQTLIVAKRVLVDGLPVDKAASQVLPGAAIVISTGERAYASRGAHKLLSALTAFEPLGFGDLEGALALDAGASTGGFTDVLLRRGVEHVVAVDVGYGQLVWQLQSHPSVTVMDRTNIRNLTRANIPYRPNLIVSDLSFISLTKVLPALVTLAADNASMLLMVKPQFELSKSDLNKGVVRDPLLRASAVSSVSRHAAELGWGTRGVTASSLPGPSGNVEYFLCLSRGGLMANDTQIETAISAGPQ